MRRGEQRTSILLTFATSHLLRSPLKVKAIANMAYDKNEQHGGGRTCYASDVLLLQRGKSEPARSAGSWSAMGRATSPWRGLTSIHSTFATSHLLKSLLKTSAPLNMACTHKGSSRTVTERRPCLKL